MKLLLDENLSRRIVPFLQVLSGEQPLVLEGLERASDELVWQ
jgi:predicted nuclease of predicted toxin-antitoxin system